MIAINATGDHTNETSSSSLTPAWDFGAPLAGDVMVAVCAAIVQTTITTPAGWSLVHTQDAGANTRLWLFTATAAGGDDPPAFTLGSATKCFAAIASFSGVDSVADGGTAGASSTTLVTAALDVPADGWRVEGAVGRHTAAGAGAASMSDDLGGTTLMTFGSNAGSGSDITGGMFYGPDGAGSGQTTTITSTATEGQFASGTFVLTPTAEPATGGGFWGMPL